MVKSKRSTVLYEITGKNNLNEGNRVLFKKNLLYAESIWVFGVINKQITVDTTKIF